MINTKFKCTSTETEKGVKTITLSMVGKSGGITAGGAVLITKEGSEEAGHFTEEGEYNFDISDEITEAP